MVAKKEKKIFSFLATIVKHFESKCLTMVAKKITKSGFFSHHSQALCPQNACGNWGKENPYPAPQTLAAF